MEFKFKISNLPTKLCPVCNREFTRRKKWNVEWDNAVYYSKRYRNMKNKK